MFLNLIELRKHFAEATILEGKECYKEECVLALNISYGMIQGNIREGNGKLYLVFLSFKKNGQITSICRCKKTFSCKHAVAAYLKTMEFQREQIPGEIDRIAQKLFFRPGQKLPIYQDRPPQADDSIEGRSGSSSWEKTMTRLLSENFQPRIENKLEIALLVEEKYHYDLRKPSLTLQVRPKLWDASTGKSSFSKIAWKDVPYPARLRLPKDHLIFFRQLHATISRFSSNESWVSITAKTADDFWNILKDHQKYHVNIVHGTSSEPVEISKNTLEAGFIIQEEQKEDKRAFRLQHRFVLPGKEIPSEKVLAVGDPPVFAVLTTDTKNISLHPVKIFNPEIFMALQKETIVIPANEMSAFQKKFLPILSQKFSLQSTSEKIEIPQEPLFILAINIQKTSANSLGLDCRYLYETTSIKLSDKKTMLKSKDGKTFLRNFEKEKNAREKVSDLLAQLPAFAKINPQTIMEERIHLKGIDAVHFMGRILPEFQKHSDLLIEFEGERPEFTFDETPPKVEFSLKENEESADWFDLNVIVSIQDEKVEFQHLFAALSEGEEFLFLENGKYFSLANPAFDQLKKLINEAKNIKDHNKEGLSLTRFQASLWDELKKLGIVTEQAEKWEKSMEGLLNFKSIHMPEIPKGLQATLRTYQHEGLSWLKFLRDHQLGGVLADEMGLGKTIQTIALFCEAKQGKESSIGSKSTSASDGSRRAARSSNSRSFRDSSVSTRSSGSARSRSSKKPFLVITPTSVVENWESELTKFAPSLKTLTLRRGDRTSHYKNIAKADIIIISYSLVHRDLPLLKPLEFDTIILDEAQFVKNHQAKIYGSIRQLRGETKIALTGTPMENNLMELWSIFSIVSPGLFASPESFHQNYRKPIEKQNDAETLERLRARIKPFIMRRKKDVVASELPPKTEQTLLLEMNKEHRHVYELHLQHERKRVLGMLQEGGLKEHRFEILSALTKMRQLCLHPGLVDEKYMNIPATKLDALDEQVKTLIAEGHRALVFSQFTQFLGKVKQNFDAAKIPYLYLDGSTTDRKSLINQFQDKKGPPVFLISLKAGGFGLNLTEADYCILLDPWWNPAVESQAIDRTHRIGQKKNVFVYKMIAKNSVEEKVLKLQEKKKQLFKNILEEGDAFSSLVTDEDIHKIFE